jgi:hypothetical protein
VTTPVKSLSRNVIVVGGVWAVVLASLFMLWVGQWTAINCVAAVILGVVGAGLTLPMAKAGLFDFKFSLRWARFLISVPKQIFVDFWLLTAQLVLAVLRRRRRVGTFVARADYPAGGADAKGTAWRAFVTVVATWSPNSYVVEIDPETGNRLAHDLVPNRASESPA